jgi:hypothetical protein
MTIATKRPRRRTRASAAIICLADEPTDQVEGLSARIARKAYELWEERGRQDGNALQDWLDAETIVTERR